MACQWITVAIILHNLVIEVEGDVGVERFGLDRDGDGDGDRNEEEDDEIWVNQGNSHETGEEKRTRLIAELLTHLQN